MDFSNQASLFIINSRSLHKLMSIALVMPSNHLILCRPLLLPPSIFPSIRVFSNESVLRIMWPKYWSFSFSISPSNEYSGLISFRIDWLDLLVVQGAFKSLLHHYSSKASILWHSAFFIVQLSHPCMTSGKTITLTRWAFVGKVMPLLYNMLSMLVIAFLPRSKCLLISWLQSPSAVILEPVKIKSVIVSTVSPSICHEMMGLDAMILGTGCHDLSKTQALHNFVIFLLVYLPSYLFAYSLIWGTSSICFTLFQRHGVFKDFRMKFQSRHLLHNLSFLSDPICSDEQGIQSINLGTQRIFN